MGNSWKYQSDWLLQYDLGIGFKNENEIRLVIYFWWCHNKWMNTLKWSNILAVHNSCTSWINSCFGLTNCHLHWYFHSILTSFSLFQRSAYTFFIWLHSSRWMRCVLTLGGHSGKYIVAVENEGFLYIDRWK